MSQSDEQAGCGHGWATLCARPTCIECDLATAHAEIQRLKALTHEPGVGVSLDEHDRYKRCLYRANGRLIQLGQEPEKLDYPSQDKCGIAATSGDDVLTPDPTTRPECRTGGVSALPPAQGASRDASPGAKRTDHAENLAKALEHYLKAHDTLSAVQDTDEVSGTNEASDCGLHDKANDAWRAMRTALHEYRKHEKRT